jgi:transcriptional regulator with PAS, ATPase and Fis domain
MIEQPQITEQEAQANLGDDEFLQRYLPGSSNAVRRLRRDIGVLNSHLGTSLINLILLRGESGVGKGHVARVVAAHLRWLRIKETKEYAGLDVGMTPYLDEFRPILLTALPENLIESELFGHKKGAFTGAEKDRDGLLKQGYTDILLDEIGDASPVLQSKLLNILEDRYFLPLGAGKDDGIRVTARILAATNKPLEQLVKMGDFREDLYWRLIEYPLHVPTLREQPENIPALCANIITELTADIAGLDVPDTPQLTEAELSWAKAYRWPGNIRELKHSLRLWLLDSATTPLPEIVARAGTLQPGKPSDSSIETSVGAYLSACLETNVRAANTLDELQKDLH